MNVREKVMMRSCPPPQQVTPSTLTDSFYQDKLHNLAESYKKLRLDFNDIQEDEFESEYAATSYNIEKSLGLNEFSDLNEPSVS